MTNMTRYICPKTREPLIKDGDALHTQDDNKTYPIIDGIPFFLSYSSLESSEQSPAEVRKLNELTPSHGWKEAMELVYGKNSLMLGYSANLNRSNFLNFL